MSTKITNFQTKINISYVAYMLYIQNWIDTHTTPEMRLNAIRYYYDYKSLCRENGVFADSLEDWLFENGYNGEMYACYGEFRDTEYQDEEFIIDLLHDEELIKLYLNDLKEIDADFGAA